MSIRARCLWAPLLLSPWREGKDLCPKGSYCPSGSYEPIKCSFSAHYSAGAYVNRPLLPLFVLRLLDVLLIFATLSVKLFARNRKTSRKSADRARRVTKAFTFANKEARSKQYQKLEDGEALHLESRISGVRRTNTGFLAAMDNDYAFEESSTHAEYVEKPDPDIQQSVQFLSRCTAAASFGLSFEFEILSFLPRGSTKPILSGVNGEIRSGTLWAIMDASGAGKSTFVNVLSWQPLPWPSFSMSELQGSMPLRRALSS